MRSVETLKPPTTARANGALVSPPVPRPIAMGRRPKTVAREVMRIGRSLVRALR